MRIRLGINLRLKLIIASLLVVVPILALLIINYQRAFIIQKERILADQLRVAQVVSVIVDDSFDEGLALARSYATDPIVLALDAERINERLRRLVQFYPEFYDPVTIFGVNGDLIASASGLTPINVADRTWFQDVVRTGRPTVSDVVLAKALPQEAIVVMAAPIANQEGKMLGVAASALSIRHLEESLVTVQRAQEQDIFLVDQTGRLAFHTGQRELTWDQRDVSSHPGVQSALEGKIYRSERAKGLFSGERLLVAVPTVEYHWVVGVSIPSDVAFAQLQESLRTSLIVFIGVLMLAIAIALATAEFLLQPLRQLIASAIAFARGHFERRVTVRTGDELEELSKSFNIMADEVQRALRLREQFLTVASHELRTPLTVIRGYAQWLLAKETAEDKRKALQTIVRQIDRISELLDEMLTVSELQAGRLELHLERFDLAAIAEAVVNRMQLLTEKHKLVFRSTGTAIVLADRNQIEVVLTNLIDNAIRYSPSGGDIETWVQQIDGEVVCSVRDYGMGIPRDRQQHVFEPFFQIHPAIAGFGGMGLGLFICKRIIDRHGGRMWFVSAEGKGSTFYFSLPVAPAASQLS